LNSASTSSSAMMVAMSRPFLLAQLSDPHIGAEWATAILWPD
jgi:hypothetical protein